MTSHSSTSTFNICPFAYRLHKIDGLHKAVAGPESNKLALGQAWHAALATIYTIKQEVDSGQPVRYRPNEQISAAFDALYPENLDPKDSVWCREGGIRTIAAYLDYYAGIDKQWEVLDVEIADDPDKPTMIIDLVARHKQSGSVYFWDHKCKAKIPWNGSRRYELDAQISRYTVWVLEKYGDCAGAVINTIVPGFRQRAYKGEPAGWNFKFERVVVSRTPQQLDYWRRSQDQWEDLIIDCRLKDSWPKHLGYQCSQCPYWELCVSADDPEVRASLYTTEPVTPFSVTVEEDAP